MKELLPMETLRRERFPGTDWLNNAWKSSTDLFTWWEGSMWILRSIYECRYSGQWSYANDILIFEQCSNVGVCVSLSANWRWHIFKFTQSIISSNEQFSWFSFNRCESVCVWTISFTFIQTPMAWPPFSLAITSVYQYCVRLLASEKVFSQLELLLYTHMLNIKTKIERKDTIKNKELNNIYTHQPVV